MNTDLSNIFVIFGGTGDLTYRKLIPAIYNLRQGKQLPEQFAVVSIGRREKSNEQYRSELVNSIKEFSRIPLKEKLWDLLKERIYYYQLDFSTDEGYPLLKEFLEQLDQKYQTKGNRIYYLAVAPEFFGLIAEKLSVHEMTDNEGAWQRVVIEKPFGRDLPSAQILNQEMTRVFREENTYRIDHYLGKEMLQNIMVIRFANALFEPIWNHKYIDHIQISSSETVGVETRGGYYEKSGALRDMIQNHMLQLLTMTTMEPPVSLKTEAIRNEKVKVLQSIGEFTAESVLRNTVRGQYGPGFAKGKDIPGYQEEERVSSTSTTETFAAIKLHINNFRWSGVPIYIRTGKRMPSKSTEVIVQFKQLEHTLYFKEFSQYLTPNLLVIRIQPLEGVYLQFNAKQPGTKNYIVPVKMDFCQNCQVGSNSPEAYERLLYDVMRGDSTLFTRWDEVEYSWKLVDSIEEVWKNQPIDFPNYESGRWGPKEADELLQRDQRNWWNISEGEPMKL
ncbi:glucose-6-phosphate dehydrogenase [Tepidibacillus marianensis]|uniref:glucose-6-phosphate dehydrogenase n=1 Tax=Tepidibacillus marianensis TaxID=3131995 RepID=UPI0030CE36F5